MGELGCARVKRQSAPHAYASFAHAHAHAPSTSLFLSWTLRPGDPPITLPAGALAAFEAAPLPAVAPPLVAAQHGPVPALRVHASGSGGGAAPPEGCGPAPPVLPLPWRHAAAALADAARASPDSHPLTILVVGPRGAGKSTLARLVANEIGSSGGVWMGGGSGGGGGGGGRPSSTPAPAPALLPSGLLWVDGDAGQPEFTPPGMLSAHALAVGGGGGEGAAASGGLPILGPPHAHARPGPPGAAAFLGSPNPGVDPARYAAGVAALGAWARSPAAAADCAAASGTAPPRPPHAVVNTHGWARGVGADLTGALAMAVAPTHVLVLASSAHPARNTPPVPWWGGGRGRGCCCGGGDAPQTLVATLEAAPSEAPPGSLSATDARAAAWLAWAVGCVGGGGGGGGGTSCPTAADFSAAAARLAAARPLAVRLGSGGGGGRPSRHRPRLVWAGGEGAAPPPGHELAALNGAVVGVGVEACGGDGEGSSSGSEEEEDEGGPSPPAPLLGLALVRAASAAPPCLYLVMPPAVADALRAGLRGGGGGEGEGGRRRLVLQAGGAELPPALLHWHWGGGGCGGGGGGGGGARPPSAGASPYLAPWCLAGVGTGARVQASRNDLARAGQQGQQG